MIFNTRDLRYDLVFDPTRDVNVEFPLLFVCHSCVSSQAFHAGRVGRHSEGGTFSYPVNDQQ